MLRIGVVAALACGGLAVTTSPALAEEPTVTITRLSPTTLTAGQTASLQYQVENDISDGGPQVNIEVDISDRDLSCSGACGSRETIAGARSFNATLRASNNLRPGSSETVTITIRVEKDNGDSAQARQQITLRGPEAPDTIRSISGRVVNIDTGKGIDDALVVMQDSDNHRYDTTTNRNGEFKFTSTESRPISPGQIDIAAGKEGFQNNQTSTNVSAGQAKSGLRITLKSNAPRSPSASASPTAEESPEETPAEEELPSEEESIDPAAAGNQESDSGGGLFSWVLIILGGLLVALGVGAIVLLVIRRKEGGEDDTGDPLPDPNGPRPTPGAQGVYRPGPEPTMVAGGAAMGGSPTMAIRPGLADAPTMMHQPVDEYPDPYGTPLRAPQPTSGPPPGAPQPGYGYSGANQGGYGPAGSPAAPMASGSAGAPTAYGSASPTGYNGGSARASASVSPPDPYAPRDRDYDAPASPPSSQGGYGYDEPTGRYDPSGGYGQASRGYEPDRGGYGQGGPGSGYDGGYGPDPAQGNGYGRQDNGYAPSSGGGYDDAPGRGGYDGGGYQPSSPSGYGSPGGGYDGYGQQQSGYSGGYEQGGYDQPGGYDRAPEPRSGGYDQPQRGYDQGYYDEPTTRGDRGNQPPRRSLDWLDD